MKAKIILAVLIVLSMLITSVGFAEDGEIFRRNISKTPDLETEKAAIRMMDFYVPAQAADGTTGEPVDNYCLPDEDPATEAGCTAYEPRYAAKPLVSVWIDGTAEWQEQLGGGIVLGAFDAFAGVSLDDGTTWKTTNLSRSASLSSFTGNKAGINQGMAFPGGVHQLVHQVFGDNIMVAWASKYCEGGSPLYTLSTVTDTEDHLTENADYFAALEDESTYDLDAVYLYDLFGVTGTQRSVDYTAQGHPEVGEIPYSCIWTMRGKLIAGDDPTTGDDTTAVEEATHVIWTKPERLTSGTRDANLPAVDCAGGAGCMLTWQEDPDGLRPGLGLGPGEGWSGAVAWQQTDIWYSYIAAENFNEILVEDADSGDFVEIQPFEDFLETTYDADSSMPKVGVPMAMPVRLTDNSMCKATNTDLNPSAPYCYVDFGDIDGIDPAELPDAPAEDGSSTFCATQVFWENPGGNALNLCVTEDNRLLNGRVASTRVRMNLKPYDSDGDTVNDSAWIVMAAEETKALGSPDEDVEPIDIGKDIWYYSFDPFEDHFMVEQGGMLNQPAQCKYDYEDDPLCDGLVMGDFYPIQYDGRDANGDGTIGEDEGYEFYLTEISRRFALTTNSVSDAVESDSGLAAMLIYKQGIINQGGPADIMVRRVLVPDTFDPTVDNPYAYGNMECDEWEYTDDSNPNYLEGLCLSPAINITGSSIAECDVSTDNNTCAEAFPVLDDGSNPTPGDFPKVYEWRQQPYGGVTTDDAFADPNDDNDLDDQSWENPYDVAKGHRGFLDGDIVMLMYAWSPNWNSNSVGNDHYNLYVRRSFDGGVNWTTTPAGLGGAGLDALEYYYGDSIGDAVPKVWTYGAGDFEQARNVSMLKGNKVTVLDPRYSPTGGTKLYPTISTQWMTDNDLSVEDDLPYVDDAERDRSKFFMVYETGDNTTVATGEAVPLDLFYSRATVYGDVWEWFDYVNDDSDGTFDDDGNLILTVDVEPRWPWLENKTDDLSGEAGMLVNQGGTFMYAVWNQWKEDILPDGHEHVYDSDIIYRRLLYLMDDDERDLQPTSSILYVSTDKADYDDPDIILIGTGRDLDRVGNEDPSSDGIDNYRWWSDIQGHVCSEKTMKAPPNGFIPGKHDFSFDVQDNEGNWSRPNTVTIWIAEQFYDTYLPLVTR